MFTPFMTPQCLCKHMLWEFASFDFNFKTIITTYSVSLLHINTHVATIGVTHSYLNKLLLC